MDAIVFAEPLRVHLVWLAVALTLILAFLEFRGADRLQRFVSVAMQQRLARRRTPLRRAAQVALVLAALLAGVVGLMRPQTPGGTETIDRGVTADIMVVLDVSNSMLAEDAAPNRLLRAKAEITEFIERVRDQRVGLVAFAGRASVVSPLTSDYGFFRLALRDVGPETVARGGTRIGDAVRKSVAAFGATRGRGGRATGTDRAVTWTAAPPRIMLLITDGEDHDSYPLDAVADAVAAGIRIVAIGFGSEEGSQIVVTDPDTGARRPLVDGDGQLVRSRLDGDLLRRMALETEGVYVPAGTSAVDLDGIIDAWVAPLVTDASARIVRRNPTEHYRWFVLAALLALVGAVWAGGGGAIAPARPEGS